MPKSSAQSNQRRSHRASAKFCLSAGRSSQDRADSPLLGLIPSVVQNTIADDMTVYRVKITVLPLLIVSVFYLQESLALGVWCSTTSTTSHVLTVSSPITCKSAWIDLTKLENLYSLYIAFTTRFLRMYPTAQLNVKLVVPCLTALKSEGSPGHVQVP